ncbi:MAG: MFS transporter [Fimbriimonadaceae bacterium]|nr:MFS transporter [Fimbriimonadaceae bacterium]
MEGLNAEVTARWRRQTLLALLIGYAGYYICRSNFSVIKPLLLEQYGPLGLDKAALGWIGTLGTLVYAIGKVTNGLSADLLGGRRMFLVGIFSSVACTVAFAALGPLAAYGLGVLLTGWTLVWAANRYVQSMGWVALAGVSARWFPPAQLAGVMGVISLSYLLGDALAQAYLGIFIKLGANWVAVMLLAAVTFAGIGLLVSRLLRDAPDEVGAEVPPEAAEHLYALDEHPRGWWALVQPFLRSPEFWMIGVMNFGLTLIRETFREWQPTFLYEHTGQQAGDSAVLSMLFPLTGAVASLVTGRCGDRLPGRLHRVLVPSLVGLAISLLVLTLAPTEGAPALAVVLTCVVSFFLIGPYTLFSGVVAMNLGGKHGAGTATGLVDSAGYCGGLLAGAGLGTIAEHHGWSAAFGVLTGVAVVTLTAGLLYWRRQEGRWRAANLPGAEVT